MKEGEPRLEEEFPQKSPDRKEPNMEKEIPPEGEGQEKTLNAGGREFKKGDSIYVIRSSGKIENNWKINSWGRSTVVAVEVDPETGEVIIDPKTGKANAKPISLEDFEKWQTVIAANEDRKKKEGYARGMDSKLPPQIRRKPRE